MMRRTARIISNFLYFSSAVALGGSSTNRQQHASAVAAIDEMLERVGGALGTKTGSRQARKPTSVTKPARRPRRTFPQNADQFVLAFIKANTIPRPSKSTSIGRA